MEIEVTCEGYEDTCCIVDEGYIDISYLHLYPEPFGLVYYKNGKMYSVKKVGNKFEAVKDVKKYTVIFSKVHSKSTAHSSLSKKQQVQFSEILKDIRDFDEPVSGNKTQLNKQLTKRKIGKKHNVLSKTRVINIVWKHRNDPNHPFEKIGKERILSLINTETYSVTDIKTKAIELFLTPLNEQYFKNKDVQIYLALRDDTILTEFETNGEKEHLWQFFSNKANGHRIQMNLLTIYCPASNVTAQMKFPLENVSNIDTQDTQENRNIKNQTGSEEPITEINNEKENTKKEESIENILQFVADEKSKKIDKALKSSTQFRAPLREVKNLVPRESTELQESPFVTDKNKKIEAKVKYSEASHYNTDSNENDLSLRKRTKYDDFSHLMEKNKSNIFSKKDSLNFSKMTTTNDFANDGVISISSSSISELERPPQRRVYVDLDDVSKLPLPFMSQIPKEHLQITDTYLGAGAFGSVRLGIHNKTEVAIKVIDILGTTPKTILKEITVLKEISHENIVSIVGVTSQYAEFWIVMGLVKGHNLKKIIYNSEIKILYINVNDSKEALAAKLDFSKQILRGITYIHLHHLDIIHRDIKPCNIVVSTAYKQVKICDLGLAKIKDFSSVLLTTQGKRIAFGTQMYMAPEILLKSEPATKSSDVWSLCCTLIELFQDRHVWDTDKTYGPTHPKPLLQKQEAPFILATVPHFIKEILLPGFDYVAERRPTSAEIFDKFFQM